MLAALSGGVDSALSAWLLQQAGCSVEAIFMKNWDEDDGTPACTASEDYASAQAVCAVLDIPLHHVSFAPEYWELVFSPLLEGYRAGHTPNPDVACNRQIKFGVLLEHAEALGFELVATGHYARTRAPKDDSAGVELLRGKDLDKDQSYFLHRVEEQALSRVLFPIGEMKRSQVRKYARQAHLPNWNRKGSTGICFIGERNFDTFLHTYLKMVPGDIVNEEGKVLGQHKGASLYTPGQRRGLGIGGQQDGADAPWYVAHTHIDSNRVTVVQGEHPLLYRSQLLLATPHWIGTPPKLPAQIQAQIRYRQTAVDCTLTGAEVGQQLLASFAQPQRAPAIGQYCVFYQGERCLGGAVIAPTHSNSTDGAEKTLPSSANASASGA